MKRVQINVLIPIGDFCMHKMENAVHSFKIRLQPSMKSEVGGVLTPNEVYKVIWFME